MTLFQDETIAEQAYLNGIGWENRRHAAVSPNMPNEKIGRVDEKVMPRILIFAPNLWNIDHNVKIIVLACLIYGL